MTPKCLGHILTFCGGAPFELSKMKKIMDVDVDEM
jgi:hypothetical protein